MSRMHTQVCTVEVRWNVENTGKFFLSNYRNHFLIFDMVKLLVNNIGKLLIAIPKKLVSVVLVIKVDMKIDKQLLPKLCIDTE